MDLSWALFAAAKGPIALGEKRCPQFATCTTSGDAGKSSVNVKLLASFKKMQTIAARSSPRECWELSQEVNKVVGQMYVPVIQGLLREAWESDPKQGASAADGWIEVVEGFVGLESRAELRERERERERGRERERERETTTVPLLARGTLTNGDSPLLAR